MTHLLQVCVTCRPSGSEDDPVRPGRRLFDGVAALDLPFLTVRPIECLSGCKRACTLALVAPGKAALLFGDLTPEPAVIEDVALMASLYQASADGLVAWKERPASFKPGLIARIPTR